MSVELLQPVTQSEVHYPDSDGKPMGETPRHIRNMFYCLYPLQKWFENENMVFVAANMFVYYVQGDPTKHVSPDLFISRGVPRERKPEWRKYLVWQEGKAPDAIIEFTSASTRHEDLVEKKTLYQDILKVQEYFLFDPWDEYLVPRLQGFRLVNGLYQSIEPVAGRVPSEVLELHLEGEGELLRFFDPKTGKHLPIPPQLDELRQQAEMARQEAEMARQHAEMARQQAEMAKQEAETARQHAEMARQDTEMARQQAEMARQHAEMAQKRAEAELTRARQEIEELRKRLPANGSST